MASSKSIIVVTKVLPDENDKSKSDQPPFLSDSEARLDALDDFNHPRIRRGYILRDLQKHDEVEFTGPSSYATDITTAYQETQSEGLLSFFQTGWQQWADLGEHGRDPMASLKSTLIDEDISIPALIPGNVPLPRDPHQRPSQNVMGQVAYYCTDTCTPVFAELLQELQQDASIISHALKVLLSSKHTRIPKVVYALPTHPGHHAANDSFGGYCYLNHAAHAAKQLQKQFPKVAVLDVDYHCGNGTASIFYDDPTILVVSIHCHPDYDYPFHSGFEDESKPGLLHLPLLPGATWIDHYQEALEKGLTHIFDEFQAQALVISLGLDTLAGDPVTLRRAGFKLQPEDYSLMGHLIGSKLPSGAPCLLVQEGGYKMDQVGKAAADVITGIAAARPQYAEQLV